MTLFEKVLKILDTFAVILAILCTSVLLAAYLFPQQAIMILLVGGTMGLLALVIFTTAKHEMAKQAYPKRHADKTDEPLSYIP